MHFFQAVMECHHDLHRAASELLDELEYGSVTPKLIRLRLEMANVVRQNSAATQALWYWIEREIPGIRDHVAGYDRLKIAERNLHVAYASHIAAWPLRAISEDFAGYAEAKRSFLAHQDRHTRNLESLIFDPVNGIVGRSDSVACLTQFPVPPPFSGRRTSGRPTFPSSGLRTG